MSLTIEQMEFLQMRGLSLSDVIEFARMTDKPRSAAAERQARYRARKKDCDVTGDVTRDVTCVTDPALSPSPNENNSNPHPHTHPDNTPRARGADQFPRPEWASTQLWADLKANRKAKRLPNTATAHAKFLRDIAALETDEWPPGRLLEAIVARGWAAAYDPREIANVRPIQRSQSARPALVDIARNLAADMEREAQAGTGF